MLRIIDGPVEARKLSLRKVPPFEEQVCEGRVAALIAEGFLLRADEVDLVRGTELPLD